MSLFHLNIRKLPFRSKHSKGWFIAHPTADRLIMRKTEQYFFENKNEIPAQIETYFTVTGILTKIKAVIMVVMMAPFLCFNCGRSKLLEHPRFFSLGLIKRGGPTRDFIKSCSYELTIVGKVCPECEQGKIDENAVPNKKVVVKVVANDLGYFLTSSCLVQAGLIILRESENMPRG